MRRAPPDELPLRLRLPAALLAGAEAPPELRGEFTHFYQPHPMNPTDDGAWEAEVAAPPGVYGYKFRTATGRWLLDPHNPRTRSIAGLRNSLLTPGGAPEPLLHAPVAPYLFLRPDGRLCVRAGLRRGHGDALRLRVAAAGTVPMAPIGAEDEHLLFEAHALVSQATLVYDFLLPDGSAVGAGPAQPFQLPLRALRGGPPDWWRDAVVYTVLLDRFRRGDGAAWPAEPAPLTALQRAALPPAARVPAELRARGGDLAGVVAALPHLRDLGVTVLHLTPLSRSPSSHRYDAVDPREVDPSLGGEAALVGLLQAARAAGLRVLIDLAVTHVHRDFFAFADVRARGFASRYAGWFYLRRYPFLEGYEPGYDHYQKGQWQEPLLNLDHPEVQDYWVETFCRYARLGADGFRLDAAGDVPPRLLQRVVQGVRALRPGALFLAELIPDSGGRYLAAGIDAVTDFGAQQAVLSWLLRGAGAQETAERLQQRAFARGDAARSLAFTATHDQPRLRSQVADARVARLGHLWLLTQAAVPALLYGDEVGLAAPPGSARDFEGAWADRAPMPWDEAAWDAETLALLRAALRLRRERAALRRGDEQLLPTAGAVLAYRRRCGEEVLDVLLNGGAEPVELPLPAEAPAEAAVLLQLGEVALGERVRLGAYAGVVLERRAPAPLRAAWQALTRDARAVAARAFAEGHLQVPALPSHLYVTVTEACNLRCRHCITEAPARTAEGRARTLQPFVIAALREGFAAADYFGFSHGGESLVAPIFWDVLAAIAAARAGRPYHAHLLSNGLLLRGGAVSRLIDGGVTSLAVSLDGARAETNDAIRLGGRFDEVIGNLREALRLRAARRADLRIGVSTVVTASNLDELPALARLCADLGVDWLKLEELVPVNGYAAGELIDLQRPGRQSRPGGSEQRRLRERVAEVREALGGVVLVDHLAAPGGCPCEAPDAAAFRAADDFANRARFLPCQAPWQQACVDPDGTVHPVMYEAPPLGSLLQAPLLALWNGPAAQAQRAAALRRYPAALRRRCPSCAPPQTLP